MKNPVNWKPIQSKNRHGRPYANRFPDLIDSVNRGTLLCKILTMKQQTPISFDRAANMAFTKWSEALWARRIGYEKDQCYWYCGHFVEWISAQGFSIELTGDEFEPYLMSDKVA